MDDGPSPQEPPVRAVVIGAGPAGLTAAWELARRGAEVVVLEEHPRHVGGLARTEVHEGFRFDLGGHRFYTKNAEVERLWHAMLPDGFITVPRLSRIYYEGRFFPYPLEIRATLRQLGWRRSSGAIVSYLCAVLAPRRPEVSFEDWIVNRFGRDLYERFFRSYTEKVWGMDCASIDKDWANQRIRGLTLRRSLEDAIRRRSRSEVKTLITSFIYPRLGPGQLWEAVRDQVEERGGEVIHGARVVRVAHAQGHVCSVTTSDGSTHPADLVFSTMPLRDLLPALHPQPPEEVLAAARSLRFRDFLTVALVVDRPAVFPDTWIYVHDPAVRVARIQNYGNWSAEMVGDPQRSCLGLEYFCNRDDQLWAEDDTVLVQRATTELAHLGLVPADACRDGVVVRVPDAYPVYDHGYERRRAVVRQWLDGCIAGLYPAGRGGLHNYNSQDHAMVTALLAVGNALDGRQDDVWAVNTDEEYAEDTRLPPSLERPAVPRPLPHGPTTMANP
jgi:protoporphyrinogen oxidase